MIMSATQEQYINSLKKIKEVEENVQKEIENHRKEIAEKIIQLDADLKNAIASANTEGEKLVESSIQQSRKKATAETEK
ncbi:MAG: archaeal/V-type ATP synthase subunit H, partial [Marine Group I thaumarchaeote]